MAIELSTFLIPKNLNTFFLLEDKFIKGGLHSCIDHADRDGLDSRNRKPGMVVVTQNDYKFWVLGADVLTWTEFVSQGSPVVVSATGDLANRALYDTQVIGFIYVDTSTADLYIKNSATSGDWSLPVHLTQGPQGIPGAQGVPGTLGPQGLQGIEGPAGLTGPQGLQGPTGLQGVAGPQGAVGPQGTPGLTNRGAWNSLTAYVQGDVVTYNGSAYTSRSAQQNQLPTNVVYWDLLVAVGAVGATGSQGAQGLTGAAGTAGLVNRGTWSGSVTYAVGDIVYYSGSSYHCKTAVNLNNLPNVATADWDLMTAQGQQGVAGPTGPQGLQGTQGIQGVAGPTGATGPTGSVGAAGAAGTQGIQGVPGLTERGAWVTTTTYAVGDIVSLAGSSYISKTAANIAHNPSSDIVNWGILASVGATGLTGVAGTAGPQGIQGTTGLTGTQGLTGLTGPAGPTGPQGLQGIQGVSGSTALHAASHATGGTDAMTPASIGAFPASGGTIAGNTFINGIATWTTAVLPYDMPFFISGVPAVSTIVGLMLAPRDISLYAGLAGSIAKAKTASTAATTFLIKMSGTQIGTVNFAAGATVGTFTFTSNVKVTSGSFLELYTGSTVDATLANIAITLVGTASAPTGVVLP